MASLLSAWSCIVALFAGTSPDAEPVARVTPLTRLVTEHRMGYAELGLDAVARLFEEFVRARVDAGTHRGAVVDIGTGYGLAAFAALAAGAPDVVAVDISRRQLEAIQASPVFDSHPEWRDRFRTECVEFPEVTGLPDELGVIFMGRLAHFFGVETLRLGLARLHERSLPGARIFASAATPYVAGFQSFVPDFERLFREGAPDPGLVTVRSVLSPERARFYPPTITLFVPETFQRVFERAGWTIERAFFYDEPSWRPENRAAGRERVGIVARRG